MSKASLAKIEKTRTGYLVLTPLVIGAALFVYKTKFLPATAFGSPCTTVAAILITATIAVPLALPTFLEIPLSISLLAAGFPAGAAVALLFAGPAINLPSIWSVARVGGWKAAATVVIAVWTLAVLGGLAITS